MKLTLAWMLGTLAAFATTAPLAAAQDSDEDESGFYERHDPTPQPAAGPSPEADDKTPLLNAIGLYPHGKWFVSYTSRQYGDSEFGFGAGLVYRRILGRLGESAPWYVEGAFEISRGSTRDDDQSSDDLEDPFQPGQQGHPPLGENGHLDVEITHALFHLRLGLDYGSEVVRLQGLIGVVFGQEFQDLDYESTNMGQQYSDSEDRTAWGFTGMLGVAFRVSRRVTLEMRIELVYLPPALITLHDLRFHVGTAVHF